MHYSSIYKKLFKHVDSYHAASSTKYIDYINQVLVLSDEKSAVYLEINNKK
jgi:hypothetical protein